MDSAQRFGRVLPGPTRLARARCTCQTPHTFADDGRALEGQTECIAVFFLLLVCAVKVRVVAVQPAIVWANLSTTHALYLHILSSCSAG